MTIGEFKAWFEGYTESADVLDLPDLDRIREKLTEVVAPGEVVVTQLWPPISIPTIFPAVQPNVPWEPFIVTTSGGTIQCDPSWDFNFSWDADCNNTPRQVD